jgi:hypothetical protein
MLEVHILLQRLKEVIDQQGPLLAACKSRRRESELARLERLDRRTMANRADPRH